MAGGLTCRDLEEHGDLHGPMFFKLLPPSRFASPPEKTALQVLQAKQILQGKKLLQAGIREEHKMNASDRKKNRLERTEMHPNVQAHIKPLKKGSAVTLHHSEQKGNEAQQNCCSKETPEGPFEERIVLLSTGKSVSISVNPTLAKTYPVEVPPSKPSVYTPASGKDAEKAQGTAAVESLKHDNYYSFAAGGLCAVATTKREWEYQEEPGQRKLELCLKDQFNKYPKTLEFYNSISAENRQRGNANGGGEKSERPQTGSKRHQNDLHHQDLGRRASGTTVAMVHTSHQRKSAARGGSTVQEPSVPNLGASSRGQRLAANSQAVGDHTPTNLIQRTSVLPANKFRMAATPTGVVIKGGKMEVAVQSGETVSQENHLLAESSHLNLEEGSGRGATPSSSLVAGGAPQLQLANLTSGGEGGVSSTLETVTPKAGASSDVTVASTAAPPVVQEPLNDLDVEDAAPMTVGGSTVVASETLSTAGMVCVTTVNHIEIKGAAEKREDTRNDTAIARVLQFEENEQAGLPHSETHVPGTRSSIESHMSSEDYRLARQMQQEYDAEMAYLVQQEEERESRARKYNSPFDERADRRNMPSTYSSPPTDNNANSRYHNRVYGRQGYHNSTTYDHYPREEEEEEEEGRHMWMRGLGMVVATRRDPPQAHVHAHVHEEMDMSYEALSQLKDVSRGLNQATISRMTETYKHEPKKDGRSGSEPQDAKCCICLQEFEAGQQLRSLPCIHAFHRYCIDKWLAEKKHCPVCLKDILDFAHQFV